jgi:hypothetical protein
MTGAIHASFVFTFSPCSAPGFFSTLTFIPFALTLRFAFKTRAMIEGRPHYYPGYRRLIKARQKNCIFARLGRRNMQNDGSGGGNWRGVPVGGA